MSKSALLRFTDRGIYCPAGEFYIDPWRPVERALLTHGHADHARPGHSRYLSTDIAAPVISHRLNNPVLETVRYGEIRQIKDALVSLPRGLREQVPEVLAAVSRGTGESIESENERRRTGAA